MSRNIFYASNTQSQLFPLNTRTQFNQYIDIHHLDYIKENEIEVAVKSIAFDNKKTFHINPNIKQPHFIIIQEITPGSITQQFFQTMIVKGKQAKNKYFKQTDTDINSFIDIKQSKDYAIENKCYARASSFTVEHTYKNRDYSNVLFISDNKVIHNIFIHTKEFLYLESFVNHINNVFKSMTFYHDDAKIEADLIQNKCELHPLPYTILIQEDIASILCVTEQRIVTHKLIDQLDKITINDFPRPCHAQLLTQDLYMAEQECVYYKVENNSKVMKLDLNMFLSTLYGIRSNISAPTIRNTQYDTLVAVFQDYAKNDVLNIEFQNPSFFKTRKELLSQAHFDIFDLDSSKKKQKPAIGSPTYIHTIVRAVEMKKHFTLFLDSSCPISKQLYPHNTNTDFIIELPERLNFRRNWTVTLKTLFLSNKMQNTGNAYITYRYLFRDQVHTIKTIKLKNEYHDTIDSIINDIKLGFEEEKIPFMIKQDKKGRVMIIKNRILKNGFSIQLELGDYLASILGYTSTPEKNYTLTFEKNYKCSAPHNPDLFLLHPKNLIVGCNIVDDTIFGGQHVKLLRLVTNTNNLESEILTFQFQQDEKVHLCIREFKSIHISIMDATGSPLKSEPNFPSRLQLMFSME